MEKVDFPGLSNNKQLRNACSLFISDHIICFPVISGSNSSHLLFYSKAEKREERYQAIISLKTGAFWDVYKWHKSNGRLYILHQDQRELAIKKVYFYSSHLSTEAIREVEIEDSIVDLMQKLLGDVYLGDVVTTASKSMRTGFCLLNGRPFSVPEMRYFASFTHSNRIYLLSCNPDLKAVSFNYNKATEFEELDIEAADTVKEVLNSGQQTCETHVIGDTVFLLREKDKQLLQLNLQSFRLTNVTSSVPIAQGHARFAFHQKYLYASHKTLNQALHRFDLRSLIVEEKEELDLPASVAVAKSTAECPVCLEPFADPKVFTKCGHSICGECEKPITVVDRIERKKTLTCPECRVATVIGLNETLPTNWALKSGSSAPISTKSPENTANSVHCEFCEEALTESKTFNCEFCAEKERKPEVFVCGTCVVKNHSNHINRVKSAEFADREYLIQMVGHISRDPTQPERELSTLSAEIRQKADAELSVFFAELRRDYEAVNCQVISLMAAAPMTKRAIDTEAESVRKQEVVIDTKIQKLADWKKEVYECFMKLNKQTNPQ